MKERQPQFSETDQPREPGPDLDSPRLRPSGGIVVIVPILLVVVTFLFWYQTWFGRLLSSQEMSKYLSETSVPHKTQHALSQLAARIARGDTTAKHWYPMVVKLAENKEPGLRSMAAWVMGQDNRSPDFHQALRKHLSDPELMVRWNAALGLARFNDPSGKSELRLMLRPFALLAPQAGTLSLRAKEGDKVRSGEVVARIRPADGLSSVDIRAPIAGRIERRAAQDSSRVAAGAEVLVLSPGEDQVWESLRALYLVGGLEDLNDVDRFARGVPGMPDRIRQQASLTAQAIRQRTASGATRNP